jgi:hypothetical protein
MTRRRGMTISERRIEYLNRYSGTRYADPVQFGQNCLAVVKERVAGQQAETATRIERFRLKVERESATAVVRRLTLGRYGSGWKITTRARRRWAARALGWGGHSQKGSVLRGGSLPIRRSGECQQNAFEGRLPDSILQRFVDRQSRAEHAAPSSTLVSCVPPKEDPHTLHW